LKKILYAALALSLVCCSKTEQSTTTTAQSETTATTQTASTTATSATETSTTTTTSSATTSAPPANSTSTTTQETKPMDYANKVAELHTTAGEIDIRFFPDKAPNHVKNFIDLAESGFYNGIKFHRIIPGFMIQGGDPNTKTGAPDTWGTGGSPNKLKAEFNDIKHVRGIVSMARTADPNSASSQFFIMVAPAPSLDGQYTAFGKVIRGMEVADKIVNAPRDANDRPTNPTTIERVVVRDAKPGELK
jgi:cyclophilin family peptidyl-prolyl cis-trans isomerase